MKAPSSGVCLLTPCGHVETPHLLVSDANFGVGRVRQVLAHQCFRPRHREHAEEEVALADGLCKRKRRCKEKLYLFMLKYCLEELGGRKRILLN